MTIASRIISFLVLAAGSDQRMGERPKAFLGAGGATLLERAVARALDCADEVLVGLRPDDMERGRRLLAGRTVAVHEGGATRRRTIEALLAAASRPWVVAHDAARPFATPRLFAAVIPAAAAHGVAIPCLQASRRDAIVLSEDGFVVGPLARDRVVLAQTPQLVRRDMLLDAYRRAGAEGWSEDALGPLLSRAGFRPRVVPARRRT